MCVKVPNVFLLPPVSLAGAMSYRSNFIHSLFFDVVFLYVYTLSCRQEKEILPLRGEEIFRSFFNFATHCRIAHCKIERHISESLRERTRKKMEKI